MAQLNAIFFDPIDAALYESKALPAGGANADSDAITIPAGDRGRMKIGIKIPALTTTQLPDAETITVTLKIGTTTIGTVVMTGAGGVGAAETRYYVTPYDSADVTTLVNVAASATAAATAVEYEFYISYAAA